MPDVIYKILTPRTVLRCYEPDDATALNQALIESNELMRRWLPFAEKEEWPLEEQQKSILDWRLKFETDGDNVFGVFDGETGGFIGSCGYHKRVGAGGIEIGYWTRISRVNQGYVTESTKALTKLAFEHYQYDRVEIHMQPDNLASVAIPKKLGFEYEATLKNRVKMSMGYKDLSIYSLFKDSYLADPMWDEVRVTAFNKDGAQVYPITLNFGEFGSCCGL